MGVKQAENLRYTICDLREAALLKSRIVKGEGLEHLNPKLQAPEKVQVPSTGPQLKTRVALGCIFKKRFNFGLIGLILKLGSFGKTGFFATEGRGSGF